jgi:hypothetical protein
MLLLSSFEREIIIYIVRDLELYHKTKTLDRCQSCKLVLHTCGGAVMVLHRYADACKTSM